MTAFVIVFGLKWTVFPTRRADHFQNRKGKTWPPSHRDLAQTFPATMCAQNTLFYFYSIFFLFAATFYFCSNFVLFSLQQLFFYFLMKQFKIAATFNFAADVI